MTLAIREVSKLSLHRILQARDQYEDMRFQLQSLRNSYLFFKHNQVDGRVKHMATLKQMGKELAHELEKTEAILTLAELRQENEPGLLLVLERMVMNLTEFFHTNELMTPGQIQETALRIAYRFGGLTLEDVTLCLHRVKNGDYGSVYNRVDGGAIMGWLQRYEQDWQAVGMERNARLHNQSKAGVWKEGHEYRIVAPKRLKELI